MKKALVLVVALLIAAPAMAGVSLTWTVTTGAAPGLDKIVGTLTSDGGNIDAIDAGIAAAPGFTGSLYQDWLYDGTFPTPCATIPGTNADSPAVDSHFLFANAMLTYDSGIYAPTEDKPAGAAAGYGTYLSGTFGLNPLVQATVLDFVQLYVPTGTATGVSYYFEVSEAGADKAVFDGTVPEPATMTLLGVGALALIRRRRK